MNQLTTDARKLVATSGANFWYPAVTDDELNNEQVLLSNYRRNMGQKRVLFSVIGVSAALMLWSYIRGDEK